MSSDTSRSATPDSSTTTSDDESTFVIPLTLQSEEERRLLDILDSVQESGLNSEIELPQLIVCGDQSSGKSSVLEAITQIPFPRDVGLCTRFATMIMLRRDQRVQDHINVRIIPGKDSSLDAGALQRLKKFRTLNDDPSRLPQLIAEATQQMGLKQEGEAGYEKFSPHTLRIEITGPDRPMLTLVDLPGFIHNGVEKQFVFDLVKGYMANPRAIILAVITGGNDMNLQAVFDECDTLDKGGRRTLGIITKPDTIARRDVRNWINLALNKGFFLERGWHVLRNRGPDEIDSTFEERDLAEEEFFAQKPWADLPKDSVGIEALRIRLSTLLFVHLKRELPAVQQEILEQLQVTDSDIAVLGEKRDTTYQQRVLLMHMATQINTNIKSAISGYYADKFFANMDMEAAPSAEPNIRRFRACVQELNMRFADFMRLKGHCFVFGLEPGVDDFDMAEDVQADEDLKIMDDTFCNSHDSILSKPKKLTRAESIKWVTEMLRRSRGGELAGHFNPNLIGLIFKEQSERWDHISTKHINYVAECCKLFIHAVIEDAAPVATGKEITERLMELSVDETLNRSLQSAKAELARILADKKTIMTYNSAFTTDIQKFRQLKYSKITDNVMREARVPGYEYGTPRALFDSSRLQQALSNSIEKSQDKFSAEEALDYTRAYYKEARSHFVQNVVVQVVERHIVENLPDTILNPMSVQSMPDDDVSYIAAEPGETVALRARLEKKKQTLEKGLLAFKQAMRGLKR
ncbi:Nn.00g092420.m01.CDS01 [Neocucurbitaria sp. VM-36]